MPFVFSPHNLRDHAGPGTRRTLARSSPHDPRGCFAVGVRPVDLPHHGQLVRAGAGAGTLTCVCMFTYSQIQCCERFNGGILSDLSVAALFIFLNRTCFNGLYRVNSKGQFNVSFGKSVHPLICDEATIFGDSELLQHVEIRCGDFSTVGSCVSAPAFYYIDPPYRPLTKTSAFTGYSEKGFDQECQIRLASFCRELSANGIC